MKNFVRKTGVLFLIFSLMFAGVFTSNNFKVFANDEETVSRSVYGSDDSEEPNPSVELIKTVTPSVAKPGDTVTYTFTVKNTGNIKLIKVILTDNMLTNELGAKANIGSLGAGEATTIIVDYTIPIDTQTGTFKNIAKVKGCDGNSNPAKDTDTAELTVIEKNPAIELIKTVNPSVAEPGDTVTYTFTVKNAGALPLYDIFLTDDMLQNEINEKIDPQNDWHIEKQEEKTIAVQYKIPENASAGKIANTATVKGVYYEVTEVTDTDTAELTVIEISPKLELTKTVEPSESKAGNTVTYTFTVKNTGNVDLNNVVVTDPMFEENWSHAVGFLGLGEKKNVTQSYTIPKDNEAGTITNTATATGSYKEHDAEATATADLTIIEERPAIELIKTVEPSEAKAHQEVTYKFVVKNIGDAALNNVVVTDPMFGADWKYPLGVLGLGENKTREFTHKFTIPAGTQSGTIENTAIAKGWYGESDNDVVEATTTANLTIIEEVLVVTTTSWPITRETSRRVAAFFSKSSTTDSIT